MYVAAIAAHHDAVDGWSLGKHDLIVRFLKGARRMNPSRSPLMPSWDLSIILAGLQKGSFEPLDSVELKFLSLKTALLTALTSIKRVGDLQVFSVGYLQRRAVVGLMDRALDLKPEVTQGCGFESRLRQEVHDCSPGAAQSAAHCSKCVHLDGLNAENTFHSSLYSV